MVDFSQIFTSINNNISEQTVCVAILYSCSARSRQIVNKYSVFFSREMTLGLNGG